MKDDIDFVLMGPNGFLGSAILRYLKSSNFSVHPTTIRLKDRLGLEALLDEIKPKLGVICAAGERGRPNIAWCDSHPVETVDANITGQLSVAAACHERGLHVILIGTGALYVSSDKKRKFSEIDPPNGGSPGIYTALRQKMEELTALFENTLVIRVLYPLSSDLDARGLLGKLVTCRKCILSASKFAVFLDNFGHHLFSWPQSARKSNTTLWCRHDSGKWTA